MAENDEKSVFIENNAGQLSQMSEMTGMSQMTGNDAREMSRGLIDTYFRTVSYPYTTN